jgi:hypothetical protein
VPVDTSTEFGAGATQLADGLDALAPMPMAILVGLIGLVPLWWAVRFIAGVFR